MKISNFFKAAAIATLSLLMASCATTVSVERQRPAELNLNGANSISVLPIQAYQNNDVYVNFNGFFIFFNNANDDDPRHQVAKEITTRLQNALLDSDFMTVVGSKRVENAIKNGSEIPCDVYLTGYLKDFSSNVKTNRRENDDGSVTTTYTREVKLIFIYEILDSTTGSVIAYKTAEISRSSAPYSSYSSVTSTTNLISSELDNLVSKIMKQLQPYTERKAISMMKDKSKNVEMAAADSCVKSGRIDEAQSIYAKVYANTGDFTAGYNSARLLQAMGSYEEAAKAMEDLFFETNNKKALSALKDIQAEMESEAKLKNQLMLKSMK